MYRVRLGRALRSTFRRSCSIQQTRALTCMSVGLAKENFEGETRVALTPVSCLFPTGDLRAYFPIFSRFALRSEDTARTAEGLFCGFR